ncbi:MAG: aryl-sulfate sulfotransferase [Candidatus Marinimicrobia bacterium]|nr:aryl-sulfate sulfotransferase [Candidatus Neomarinimicrobiota bacterium]
MRENSNIVIIFWFASLLFSQDAFEGYTLFTPGGGGGGGSSTTYLKDNNLNNINTWSHGNGPASMPYLISGDEPGWENTLLVYPYRVNNPTMESGGVGGAFEVLTWDGELVWEYELSNSDYQHHHDVEPLPNGNVLLIAWEKKTSTEAYAAGRTTLNGNPLNQMWSSAIFEIQHNGNGGGEVVWEWHLWDHLIQDADSGDDNYGVVTDHPELFDINNGNVGGSGGPGGANADWMHLNAISYNVEYDQIVISSRHQCEIFVIDHSTTTEEAAGHSGGNYGKGGDFLYRWGNPQNYDRGNNSDNLICDQHSVNWIPNGYPGEGNFILFNNSGNEAIEFIPPVDEDGFYVIEDGQPYGPDDTIWDSPYYSTAMQGGAFRLPNGNTLITDCDSADIEEVTESGSVVWSYSQPGNNANIARAQKYAIDYFDAVDEGIAGDINDDGILNILDIVSLVNLVLSNNYEASGDINGDNMLNILDIVSLVNLILIS